MKKGLKILLTGLLIIATLVAAVACKSDNGGMKNYESAGLKFSLPKEMKEANVTYADLAYANDEGVEFFIYFYSATELLTEFYIDKKSTVYEYASTFIQNNDYDQPTITDGVIKEYDEANCIITLSYTYLPEMSYYYDYIVRTENNLYHVTMTCREELAEKYQPIFKEWSKLISVENI